MHFESHFYASRCDRDLWAQRAARHPFRPARAAGGTPRPASAHLSLFGESGEVWGQSIDMLSTRPEVLQAKLFKAGPKSRLAEL